MGKCTFCGNEVEKGTGLVLVQKTGRLLNFCTSKCERNLALGRKPRDVRWTQDYRKTKGKLTAAAEKEELRREAAAAAQEEGAPRKPRAGVGGAAAKKLKG